MEMYPQKRFAPGRRRINAAHHVLTQPIGTFSTVRVFLYFCVSNVTCLSGQLGFLWLCAPIIAAVTCPDKWFVEDKATSPQASRSPPKRSSPVLEAQRRLGRISNIRAPTKTFSERQISTPKTNSLGVEIPIYTSTFLILSATMR